MKRQGASVATSGEKTIQVAGATDDAGFARLGQSEDAAHGLIYSNQFGPALLALRTGGWRHPEKKFVRMLAYVASKGALIGGVHVVLPDGTKKYLDQAPLNPEAWHGPN